MHPFSRNAADDSSSDSSSDSDKKTQATTVVRVVPAVRWKYDNLLNTLDVRSLVVAMLTLMGAFAIRLERRDDPLAVYGLSAETVTSYFIIMINIILVVSTILDFRSELTAVATGAVAVVQGPMGIVHDVVIRPVMALAGVLCAASCALFAGRRPPRAERLNMTGKPIFNTGVMNNDDKTEMRRNLRQLSQFAASGLSITRHRESKSHPQPSQRQGLIDQAMEARLLAEISTQR